MKGGVPICVFDQDIGMFRIVYTKGKALFSYGVSWSKERSCTKKSHAAKSDGDGEESNCVIHNQHNIHESNEILNIRLALPMSVVQPLQADYLFMEEVLFLHERGLLHVAKDDVDERNKQKEGKDDEKINPFLQTKDLYQIMLHQLHMPLQVYLTYSNLRSKNYIVVRHTSNRLNIVRSIMVENVSKKDNEKNSIQTSSQNDLIDKKSRKRKRDDRLKLDLRFDTFHAPIPFVFGIENNDDGNHTFIRKHPNTRIAFDVYKPNSNYRKSNPGQPDFYVAVCNFSQPSPTFGEIQALISACDKIPLRMAAVADGGTVIMFGLTDYGVPSLVELKKEEKKENSRNNNDAGGHRS